METPTFKIELRLVKRDAEDDSLQSTAVFVDVSAQERVERFKLRALQCLGIRDPRPGDLGNYLFIQGATKMLRHDDNDRTCADIGLSDRAVVRVLSRF